MPFAGVIDASQGWLTSAVLLATRLGGLLLMTPPIGAAAIPATARVLFVVALAAVLAATIPAGSAAHFEGLSDFGSAAVGEFTLGATMALGISFAFAAFAIGARLLDVQIGFLPFLLIDLIVSSILMALGMMMMPPITIALPLKLLMFILVDGWSLILKALVGSFH